jgi:ATP-dependent protease ClpP protease subunit
VSKNATEIRLQFWSDGGNNAAAFGLYNFLRSLPVPLTTHSTGNVESSAVIVFLAGSKRLACSSSRFLIHGLHWGFDAGQVDHQRLREYVASLDNDMERYATIFDERTGDAAERIDVRKHLLGEELLVPSHQAVAAGFVDAVAEAETPQDAVNWWVNAS